MDAFYSTIDFWQKELLLFASICFFIGALDDFVFDLLWLVHRARNVMFNDANRIAPASPASRVSDEPERRMAIFVPAWREAAVIGQMLRRCLQQWEGQRFRLYVGCYPNDDETIAAVVGAARGNRQIRLVLCDGEGPTTKADCLNRLWRSLCRDELEERQSFTAVILHDAEDIVHAEQLRLYDRLIGTANLVQLPVIPRRASGSLWIAGHYCDEFAELHGKQMVLREALGVAIPSAGVGCALEIGALRRLADEREGMPFDTQSLTEDYELGLQITQGSSRGIFARMRDQQGQLIATQEFFPEKLGAAVRQKSRWITGIALTGWDRVGWHNAWLENWMRMRDRKMSFAAIVLAIGYVAVILTAMLGMFDLFGWYQPEPLSPLLWNLLQLNLVFLSWRLVMKAGFVFDLYGPREAVLSVPRTIVANFINILAAGRAVSQYWYLLSGRSAVWEKTAHFYHPEQAAVSLRNADGRRPAG